MGVGDSKNVVVSDTLSTGHVTRSMRSELFGLYNGQNRIFVKKDHLNFIVAPNKLQSE